MSADTLHWSYRQMRDHPPEKYIRDVAASEMGVAIFNKLLDDEGLFVVELKREVAEGTEYRYDFSSRGRNSKEHHYTAHFTPVRHHDVVMPKLEYRDYKADCETLKEEVRSLRSQVDKLGIYRWVAERQEARAEALEKQLNPGPLLGRVARWLKDEWDSAGSGIPYDGPRG